MKFVLIIPIFISFLLAPSSSQKTNDCSTVCEEVPNCSWMIDANCVCQYECVASSQTDKTTCPDEPCPTASNFCTSQRNSQTCECEPQVCCSPPYCPKGYEVCDSCDNCRCRNECPSDPCPSSSSFCYGMRDDENCDCFEACCAPPSCENSEVDWANCFSCDYCPCLPATKPLYVSSEIDPIISDKISVESSPRRKKFRCKPVKLSRSQH